jgi:hypothetical protein
MTSQTVADYPFDVIPACPESFFIYVSLGNTAPDPLHSCLYTR